MSQDCLIEARPASAFARILWNELRRVLLDVDAPTLRQDRRNQSNHDVLVVKNAPVRVCRGLRLQVKRHVNERLAEIRSDGQFIVSTTDRLPVVTSVHSGTAGQYLGHFM